LQWNNHYFQGSSCFLVYIKLQQKSEDFHLKQLFLLSCKLQIFWALKLLASSFSKHHLFSAFISKWSQHDLSRHTWTLDTWSLQGYVRNQNVVPKSGRVNGLWALWLLCRSVWVLITLPHINTGSKDTTRLVWIKAIPILYSGTWGDTNLGLSKPARGRGLPNTMLVWEWQDYVQQLVALSWLPEITGFWKPFSMRFVPCDWM